MDVGVLPQIAFPYVVTLDPPELLESSSKAYGLGIRPALYPQREISTTVNPLHTTFRTCFYWKMSRLSSLKSVQGCNVVELVCSTGIPTGLVKMGSTGPYPRSRQRNCIQTIGAPFQASW
jgi:hypothetical protein